MGRVFALVLATYGDTCCHCGQPGARTSEHIHPRSLGGTDQLDNLRPAHRSCNSSRGIGYMAGFGARPITFTTTTRW